MQTIDIDYTDMPRAYKKSLFPVIKKFQFGSMDSITV